MVNLGINDYNDKPNNENNDNYNDDYYDNKVE